MRFIAAEAKRTVLLLAVASLLALVTFSARGDVITLNTGGRLEGQIIDQDADQILVKTAHGITRIYREDIEGIEEKPTVWEIYTQKSTKTGDFDIEGHYELARWCEGKRGLEQEYRTELELVLSLKPDHKEAGEAYAKLRQQEEKRLAKYARSQALRSRKARRTSGAKRPARGRGAAGGEAEIPELKAGERQEITLDPVRRKKINKLIDKFFTESPENVKARQDILAEIDKLGPIPKGAISSFRSKIFKKCKSELFSFVKTGKGNKYQLKHKTYPGVFILGMPRARGKKYPLLVGLHGGGKDMGEGWFSAQKWSRAAAKGFMTCFPTVIKKVGSAWNKEREEKYVIQLIQELKRAFPIDTNRIYLCGHSMGGFGTWSIGTNYADVFAAISPNAGGTYVRVSEGGVYGSLVNLKATPIYFYHGADDKNVGPGADRRAAEALKWLKAKHGPYEYIYKEYNGIGHGGPRGGYMKIVEWMIAHKRKPYPDFIIWQPSRPYKKLFWWIKVRGAGGQIIAKYHKAKNLIEIEGSSYGLSVFLNDKMVNLSKPVKVMFNGKEVFNDYVYYSASALLESIQDKKDPGQYFTAKIDL